MAVLPPFPPSEYLPLSDRGNLKGEKKTGPGANSGRVFDSLIGEG